MKNMPNLTATRLYGALIASLVIIIASIGVGFYFAHEKLTAFATDVSQSVAKAEDSSYSLQRLQNTERSLEENKKVIKDGKNIVAVAESYKYQNQIINDINKYAKKSGVVVTQYTFDSSGSSSSSSSSSKSSSKAGSESGSTKTPTSEASTGASLKTASVSVAVKNPTNYRDLLKFIKHIENNLTNMQIARISLAGAEGGSDVTTDTFNIEVHIK